MLSNRAWWGSLCKHQAAHCRAHTQRAGRECRPARHFWSKCIEAALGCSALPHTVNLAAHSHLEPNLAAPSESLPCTPLRRGCPTSLHLGRRTLTQLFAVRIKCSALTDWCWFHHRRRGSWLCHRSGAVCRTKQLRVQSGPQESLLSESQKVLCGNIYGQGRTLNS